MKINRLIKINLNSSKSKNAFKCSNQFELKFIFQFEDFHNGTEDNE